MNDIIEAVLACDTCALCAALTPPHEAYSICIWKPPFGVPSNVLAFEIARLEGNPQTNVARWIPNSIVNGPAKNLLKPCPAHQPVNNGMGARVKTQNAPGTR